MSGIVGEPTIGPCHDFVNKHSSECILFFFFLFAIHGSLDKHLSGSMSRLTCTAVFYTFQVIRDSRNVDSIVAES